MPKAKNELLGRIFVLVIMVLLTSLYWFFMSQMMFNTGSIVSKIIFGSIFSIFYLSIILVFYLIPNFRVMNLIYAFLGGIIPLLFFQGSFLVGIIVVILNLFLLWLAYRNLQKALSVRLKFVISVFQDAYNPIALGLMIIMVAASFWYFRDTAADRDIDVSKYINQNIFNTVLKNFMPGYEKNITVDQYIEQTSESINDSLVLQGTEGLSQGELDQLVEDTVNDQLKQSREELGKSFELDLTGDELLQDVIFLFLNQKLNEQKAEHPTIFAAGIAFTNFLLISTLKTLCLPLVLGLAFLIKWLFVRFEIYKVEIEKVDKETLVF